MRIRCVWGGVLVALLVPAVTASAASQTVTANALDQFVPPAVTVLAGESVTWNNGGGFHNVHFDDDSFDQPPEPLNPPWPATVARTFDTVGTFGYYCEAHAPSMSGTVTVQAAGTTPGPGPTQPQPVSADKTAPVLKLGGQRNQKVVRRRAILVLVEVGEAATVVARGTIAVPGAGRVLRTRKVSRQLAQGAKAELELRLSKQTFMALRRALRKRPRLAAKLTVTATDAAGNRRTSKRSVALRR